MNAQQKVTSYKTLRNLVARLRDDFNNSDFVLLYAYNGTGKTRISMEFKDAGKLSELKSAADSGEVFTHHFNALRSILEKTAVFFGYNDFSDCIHGIDDEALFTRALNLLSHGRYSLYQPQRMGDDTKDLFTKILNGFLQRNKFNLPRLLAK